MSILSYPAGLTYNRIQYWIYFYIKLICDYNQNHTFFSRNWWLVNNILYRILWHYFIKSCLIYHLIEARLAINHYIIIIQKFHLMCLSGFVRVIIKYFLIYWQAFSQLSKTKFLTHSQFVIIAKIFKSLHYIMSYVIYLKNKK